MNALDEDLQAAREDILDRCTACGECYRACPVVPLTDLAGTPAEQVVPGVLSILKGEQDVPQASLDWAGYCTRCGACLEACEADINPRRMLALCEGLAGGRTGISGGGALFRRMARSIRVLAGLQLNGDRLRYIQHPLITKADVVFYAGCNILQTPHILLNAADLLSLLGTDFQIAGGVGYCCGVVHFRGGELDKANRITQTTYERLHAFNPDTVLSWCPTCEIHLGETVDNGKAPDFELAHFTDYLASQRESLASRMNTPIKRRVALHEHSGHPHIAGNVRSLLDAIPGLDWFPLDDGAALAYSCNVGGLSRVPEAQARTHRQFRERAVAQGAEQIIDVYHGCHLLLADGRDDPPVRNFTDLLLEALGQTPNEDRFQKYRSMPGIEQIFADAHARMAEAGLDPDEIAPLVSRVLVSDRHKKSSGKDQTEDS